MKKKINIPLIIITIAVWGIILYSIAEIVWFKQESTGDVGSGFITNYDENKIEGFSSEFHYKYLDKDPFKLKTKVKTQKSIETKSLIKPVQNEQIVEDEWSNFTLSGVVINSGNKNIILNDHSNNEIIFLKEGEQYKGLKVAKVSKQQVEFIAVNSGKSIISKIE